MKKKLLMLIVPVIGTLFGYSQAEITVTAPAAATGSSFRSPNGTTAHTTMRGVIIIPASELTGIPVSTILTKLSLIVSTAGSGPATGTMQYYLENTPDVTNLKPTNWASIIAPMTSVYNGTFSLPAAVGPTGDLTLSTPFNYTGGSLYVAYDYLGSTFAATACVYSANSSLAGGWKGLASATTTPPATLTQTSAFRPSFQFTFDNPFTNELNVSGLAGEKGSFNNTIKTTQTVTSLISNISNVALMNVPVTLSVAGANSYTMTQTVASIASGSTSTILFNNVPTSSLGSQTITVSVPSDQNNTNNSRTFTQKVQCDTIGYAQSPVQSGAVGFNTAAGLIAVRHQIPNTIETYVKSVSNYFPNTANIAGNTMKGILLDGNGVIIDSTAVINVTAGMLGTKQDFNFIDGTIDVSGGTIYVGFRQDANATTGYFPFASQNNSYVDPNAAATFNLFGGGTNPLGSSLGYMMIEAVLTFGGFDVTNSSNAGIVCMNSSLNITPTAGYMNYEFFVNGSSLQNGATSSYSTAPLTAGTTFSVNIMNGTCALNSNLQTITVPPAILNNISAAICPSQTYTFGSQTLSTGGTYTNTLVSALGCDSVVVLNLSILSTSSSSLNASICLGNTYTFGSQVLSTTGIYTHTTTNVAGCDSVITLNLMVNTPTSSNPTLTVCDNTYQFGSQTLTTSGVYTRTIVNVAGCDSVITLNLTLNAPFTVTATTSGISISSAASSSVITYQWIDCGTNNAVMGEISSIFSPTVSGSYAVVVGNSAACTNTSNCVTVNLSTVGLNELSPNALLQVYPNPNKGVFTVELINDSQIKIIDMLGKLIITQNFAKGKNTIDLSNYSNGIYIISIYNNGLISKSKIIKE